MGKYFIPGKPGWRLELTGEFRQTEKRKSKNFGGKQKSPPGFPGGLSKIKPALR
jgi:hypothetical protein